MAFKEFPSQLPINPQPEPMLEHAIRQRAYELYVERGRGQGHAVDDWLKAEAEIIQGHSSSNTL
jgi:hypothetical protein